MSRDESKFEKWSYEVFFPIALPVILLAEFALVIAVGVLILRSLTK